MTRAELAANHAAQIRAALKAHASALAANARDAKRLAALVDDIATFDARLDAEDVNQIQRLAASRDQQSRLATKYAADAEARLAAAEQALDDACDRDAIGEVFASEEKTIVAAIAAAVAPFGASADAAARLAGECAAVRRLRAISYASRYGNPPPFAEIAAALEAIAAGKT